MSENFLSVSELNNFIRDVLKSGFPQSLWVCGEIQELKEKNGHLYFTLAEKDPSGSSVVAKIGVSIWVNSRPKIDAILSRSENSFKLKDDIQVKLLCKVDFYPPFGQLRLIAESIDPVYTLGLIAQDRLRIIAQLKQQGILDLNKRLLMPLVPLTIGLITSYDSAAYHDFMDEVKHSGIGFKIRVCDCVMQGKGTELSIIQAIKQLTANADVDVLIITRGGGSITDLSAFDSAKIAQAIAQSPIPVITGIGHEINTTIADLAAHTFAKTPTATAQWLIGRVNEFKDNVKEKEQELIRLSQDMIYRQQIRLKDAAHELRQQTLDFIKTHAERLLSMASSLNRQPIMLLKENRRHLVLKGDYLKKTIQLNLLRSQTKIQSYSKVIEVVDPKNTLKRGFTITRSESGKIIRSLKDVKNIKVLKTQLIDGDITSTI